MSLIDIPKTGAQRIIAQATKNQSVYEEISMQISSGKQHQDFKGYAGDGNVERLLSANEMMAGLNDYKRSNTLAINRLKNMENSLNQLQSVAIRAAELITSARNPAAGDDMPITISAQAMLDEITGNLNAKFNGKYLFSGAKTDTPPLGEGIMSSNIIGGQVTANYYQGDSFTASVSASNTQEITYGVTADAQAFQELIGALHLLMEGYANGDADMLEEASGMISSATDAVVSLQADVRSSRTTLQNTNDSHDDAVVLVTESLNEISDTDIVEASALLSQIEAQIQASYMAYTRLSNLNLANFL